MSSGPLIATLDTVLNLAQVCRLLENLEGRPVSRSLVNYYGTRVGNFEALVPASKRKHEGRGRGRNMRLYSVTDVVLLRWLIQLAKHGLEVRKFYRAVSWLRDHIPEALTDPGSVFFLTDNAEVGLCCRTGVPIQLTGTPGQILLALPGSSVSEVLRETTGFLWALTG
jgi:hypothetical protein